MTGKERTPPEPYGSVWYFDEDAEQQWSIVQIFDTLSDAQTFAKGALGVVLCPHMTEMRQGYLALPLGVHPTTE